MALRHGGSRGATTLPVRSENPLPRLHLIAGDDVAADSGYQERLAPVAEAGGRSLAVHLRFRCSSAARLFEVAAWLAAFAKPHGTLVIVNDRADVAVAASAGGVHLREDSIPDVDARRIAGRSLWLGRSIHAPLQATCSEPGDVDYFILGAVYPTRSHPGRRALGVQAVRAASEGAAVPVLAIGGITPERIPEVLSAGAYGTVVASGVWGAESPARAVRKYRRALA